MLNTTAPAQSALSRLHKWQAPVHVQLCTWNIFEKSGPEFLNLFIALALSSQLEISSPPCILAKWRYLVLYFGNSKYTNLTCNFFLFCGHII